MDKVNIGLLVVITGQACTLRCRDCGNFSPFAPKETLRYDVNKILEYLKILVRHSKIGTLQVQGGEPFIYPQLDTLLEFVRDCPEIEKCTIATNGTVIPNVRAELLKNKKFEVSISSYPINIKNRRTIQNWFESNSIKYSIYHFASNKDYWFDMGKEYNSRGGGRTAI